MKFFNITGMMAAVALLLGGCSQNDAAAEWQAEPDTPNAAGEYAYTMTLNCPAPGFSDGNAGATRGVDYTWNTGDVLYLRFKNGSSYVSGTATYNGTANTWSVSSTGTLPVTTAATACEMYYFENAGTASSGAVALTEQTACYATTTATYTHPTSSTIQVSGLLEPQTWRLRFKGAPNTKITMPLLGNDLRFNSSFDKATGIFTTDKKKIELTVGSNGYTPYLYGVFGYSSIDNDLCLEIDDYTYTRKLSPSLLPVGKSGFFDVPTTSAYDGWGISPDPEPVKACQIRVKDFVIMSNGYATGWTVGSKVAYGYTMVMRASTANEMTDSELIDQLKSMNSYTGEEWGKYVTSNDKLQASTDYYILSIAYDESGNDGGLVKYPFTTKSDANQPLAAISNLRATTSNGADKWAMNVTMTNGAEKYYLFSTESSSNYNSATYFFAWAVYQRILAGTVSTYTYTSPTWNRSASQVVVVAWAVDANDNLSGLISVDRLTLTLARAEQPLVYVPADESQHIDKRLLMSEEPPMIFAPNE